MIAQTNFGQGAGRDVPVPCDESSWHELMAQARGGRCIMPIQGRIRGSVSTLFIRSSGVGRAARPVIRGSSSHLQHPTVTGGSEPRPSCCALSRRSTRARSDRNRRHPLGDLHLPVPTQRRFTLNISGSEPSGDTVQSRARRGHHRGRGGSHPGRERHADRRRRQRRDRPNDKRRDRSGHVPGRAGRAVRGERTRDGFADAESAPFTVDGGATEQVLVEMRLTFVRESVDVVVPANSPTESLQPVAVSDVLTGAKMDIQPLAGDDFQSLLTVLPSIIRGPKGGCASRAARRRPARSR